MCQCLNFITINYPEVQSDTKSLRKCNLVAVLKRNKSDREPWLLHLIFHSSNLEVDGKFTKHTELYNKTTNECDDIWTLLQSHCQID